MNCKPGDLAIVTKTMGVPTAVKILGMSFKLVQILDNDPIFGPRWSIEGDHYVPSGCGNESGQRINAVADCILTPIRDNDGEDETLTWAGKPHKETA